jgi:hypothetical protein
VEGEGKATSDTKGGPCIVSMPKKKKSSNKGAVPLRAPHRDVEENELGEWQPGSMSSGEHNSDFESGANAASGQHGGREGGAGAAQAAIFKDRAALVDSQLAEEPVDKQESSSNKQKNSSRAAQRTVQAAAAGEAHDAAVPQATKVKEGQRVPENTQVNAQLTDEAEQGERSTGNELLHEALSPELAQQRQDLQALMQEFEEERALLVEEEEEEEEEEDQEACDDQEESVAEAADAEKAGEEFSMQQQRLVILEVHRLQLEQQV